MFSKTLAFLGLASVASTHIIMTNPVPFGNPDSSPLLDNGSNFPCKGPVSGGSGESNVYEQGSTQQLSFQGTAVHGGGSCQVSVTTDLNPTRDSVWKVIKSIEGGCPAQGAEGNIGNSATAEVPYKYDFTIPDDLAAGEYVLAWTWFNKVGNREMYMNCAPVTVTGSSGDEGFMSTLPDMFVANIGNGCITPDSLDVEFPNPGNFIDRLNGATSAFAAITDPVCLGGAPGSPGPTQPVPLPSPTGAPTSPPEAPAPTATNISTPSKSPAPSPTYPGGIFITVTTGAPTPTAAPETPQPEMTPSQVPNNPSGGISAGTPCSTEGDWNCIDGASFQRCASGAWSAVQPMAAGMECESGQSSEFKMAAISRKRAMRRSSRRII